MNKFMEDEVMIVAHENRGLGEDKTKQKGMRVALMEWMSTMMMVMTRRR